MGGASEESHIELLALAFATEPFLAAVCHDLRMRERASSAATT